MNASQQERIQNIKLLNNEILRLENCITYCKQEIKRLSPVTRLDAKQILAELDERRARLAVANKPVSERINYDASGILIPFQE